MGLWICVHFYIHNLYTQFHAICTVPGSDLVFGDLPTSPKSDILKLHFLKAWTWDVHLSRAWDVHLSRACSYCCGRNQGQSTGRTDLQAHRAQEMTVWLTRRGSHRKMRRPIYSRGYFQDNFSERMTILVVLMVCFGRQHLWVTKLTIAQSLVS